MNDKTRGKILTGIFLIFLCGMGLIGISSPSKVFSASENRYLNQKPDFSWKTLLSGKFGRDYETYLSDQFPVRDHWISIKVLAERMQFKQDVNGVYFGKNGYLIEKFDSEDLIGDQLEKNLNWLSSFTREMQDFMGEDHVRVMLVPSASEVITDKLPPFAAPFQQSQMIEDLSKQFGENTVVPVNKKLSIHREEPIYYKTDHHWTALGAYYGYQSWAESIGMAPWKQEAFNIRQVSSNFYGTIHSKLNRKTDPDTIELYLPKEESDYLVYYDGGKEPANSLYQLKALEGKDQYAVYLDGNHGLTEIVNQNIEPDGEQSKLLVIKDSFANSFAPFAANHFRTTYLVDLRYFNLDITQFVKENGITDILLLYQIPGFAKEKTISKLEKQK